jgi:drug/metabolite transporter (DMT)-like permease
MDITIATLVLASAALHPLRDLLVKGGLFRESAYIGITVVWIAISACHGLLTQADFAMPSSVWPMIAFSTLGLVLYYVGITISLRHGELSVYYPIIRSSPLMIVAINLILFGYPYEWASLAGIGLAVAGAFFIQFKPGAGLLSQPVIFLAALMAMIGHSILTLADAHGMQQADPAPFLFWVYSLLLITQLTWFGLTKPIERPLLQHLFGTWRTNPNRVLFASILSYASYILILIAFQKGGEAAAVASIRQASIPISVLLGAFILHEGRLGHRLGWSLVLAAGIVILITVK